MTELEFNHWAARGYNRVPVVLETLADLDTPLSIYLKLANRPYSYLLESVIGGERFGRYSIIGLPADLRIEVTGRQVALHQRSVLLEQIQTTQPLDFIKDYLGRFKAAPLPGLPRFCGGLVGYFGYDTVRYIEPRLARAEKDDALGTPDILLMLSEQLAVVDNLLGKLYLVVYADPREPGAYAKARGR